MKIFRFLRERLEAGRLRIHLARVKAALPEILWLAHKRSSRQREEILASEVCGCFYCGRIYSPEETVEWRDEGQTAICPMCRIDSVIGSASGLPFTTEFLDDRNRHWFGKPVSTRARE